MAPPTHPNNTNNESNWSEWSMYVLKELERLNQEAEDLYEKMEEHNASKETLETIKKWKLKVESIATFDDFRAMKTSVGDLKTFRTQVITAVVVIQVILGGAAIVVNWLINFYKVTH